MLSASPKAKEFPSLGKVCTGFFLATLPLVLLELLLDIDPLGRTRMLGHKSLRVLDRLLLKQLSKVKT